MSKIILLSIILLLTGCATPPQFLAQMYDNADPCQQWADKSRPLGDQIPSWCGAGGKSVYVKGYSRSSGTYVRGHYRSSPDGNPNNNFSSR